MDDVHQFHDTEQDEHNHYNSRHHPENFILTFGLDRHAVAPGLAA